MEIKVLGPGCINCQTLEKNTIDALSELGVSANVDKVTDVNQYADYGVMMTPALVVNGNLKVSGRVPAKDEIKKWIEEESS